MSVVFASFSTYKYAAAMHRICITLTYPQLPAAFADAEGQEYEHFLSSASSLQCNAVYCSLYHGLIHSRCNHLIITFLPRYLHRNPCPPQAISWKLLQRVIIFHHEGRQPILAPNGRTLIKPPVSTVEMLVFRTHPTPRRE